MGNSETLQSLTSITHKNASKLAKLMKAERLKNPSIRISLDQAKAVYMVFLDYPIDGKELLLPYLLGQILKADPTYKYRDGEDGLLPTNQRI